MPQITPNDIHSSHDFDTFYDEQVYQLYGLTCEEIALIKQTYEEAGMQR